MNNERTDAHVINRHFECDLLYLEQHFLNEPKGGAFASTLLGWGGGGGEVAAGAGYCWN